MSPFTLGEAKVLLSECERLENKVKELEGVIAKMLLEKVNLKVYKPSDLIEKER